MRKKKFDFIDCECSIHMKEEEIEFGVDGSHWHLLPDEALKLSAVLYDYAKLLSQSEKFEEELEEIATADDLDVEEVDFSEFAKSLDDDLDFQ